LTTPLAVNQAMTAAFIADSPTAVILTPQAVLVEANGARKLVPQSPRAEQTFKLIPMTFDQRPTLLIDGVERIISYTLLGTHDSIMEVWDTWTGADGSTYLIVAMAEGFGYEKKGLVERRLPVG
jgi:hypothetical protein